MLTESKRHLQSIDETYFEHMAQASGFGWRMVIGGLACLVHALVPGFFKSTGSRTIRDLHDRMVVNRRQPTVSEPQRR